MSGIRVSRKELATTIGRVLGIAGLPSAVAAPAAELVLRTELMGLSGLRALLCEEPGTWRTGTVRDLGDHGVEVSGGTSLLWYAGTLPAVFRHEAARPRRRTLVLSGVRQPFWLEAMSAGLAAVGLSGSVSVPATPTGGVRVDFGEFGTRRGRGPRPDHGSAGVVWSVGRPAPGTVEVDRTWSPADLQERSVEALRLGVRVDGDAWARLSVRASAVLVRTSARSRLGAG
jgi:hypothetical protein